MCVIEDRVHEKRVDQALYIWVAWDLRHPLGARCDKLLHETCARARLGPAIHPASLQPHPQLHLLKQQALVTHRRTAALPPRISGWCLG
eukprot:scaffold9266_cov110-Isochrysis_galbana.AAC.3